jgi:hypothetical protein
VLLTGAGSDRETGDGPPVMTTNSRRGRGRGLQPRSTTRCGSCTAPSPHLRPEAPNTVTGLGQPYPQRPLEGSSFWVVWGYQRAEGVSGRKPRSRRLFETTNTDENAIAAPAIIGLSNPSAASGSAATL